MVQRFRLGVSLSVALYGAIVAFSGDLGRSVGNASIALGLTLMLAAACVSIQRAYVGKLVWITAILFFLGRAFCVGPIEDGVWSVVYRGREFRWVQRSSFAVKSLYDETLQVPKTGVTLIERESMRGRREGAEFSVHWSVAEQDLPQYVATYREGRTVERLLEELFPAEMADEELAAFKRRCRRAGVSIGGIYRDL